MLILPSVSIGNVPQLALDLLIYTYGFELVKSLDDSMLSPFIGPMDHVEGEPNESGISTAAQLFKHGEHYLVQLRSPPLPGCKMELVKSLIHDIPKTDPGSVLIIGSANAGTIQNMDSIASGRITEVDSVTPLPDSGFVNDALKSLPGSKALVSWVYEGDNFKDSVDLAKSIAEMLQLPRQTFKQPVSWSRVYGKDVPLGIEKGLYT